MLQIKVLIPIAILSSSIGSIFAQTENKEVSITASGSGVTQEDAKQTALRSAIEQAYGAFISTKTEMLNDQVVADEMISVSAGNIKSYEILSQDSLPNGRWGLTLKALVSIDKLTSFVEAKGGTVEIKGGLFALNIKQQLLNEQGEIKAVSEMVGLLHEPMQIAFDYSIKSGDPKSIDAESKNWEIPLAVTATCNKNIDFCANYCIKTLEALSLSPEEFKSYQNLNKAIFPIIITYNGVSKGFVLRKQSSLDAINTLINQWEFYTRLFTVNSGIEESNGNGEGQLYEFITRHEYEVGGVKQNVKIINFLTAGQIAAVFSWQDKRTLSQIEQMSGYTVKPRGIISFFKHGGFVVQEKDGHGLIMSLIDISTNNNGLEGDRMKWIDAKIACENLIINGYNDWRLPTREEAITIGKILGVLKVGNFQGARNGFHGGYWTSSPSFNFNTYWHVYLNNGSDSEYEDYGSDLSFARAVRTF